MQQLNCVSFLLGLAILSAALGPFVAIAHRELLMVANSEKVVESKLDLSDKTKMTEETGNKVLAGRKMGFGDAVMEMKGAKEVRNKASSGAKHFVGKCGHGGSKDLSMNCYFRSRKLPPKVNFDGHIPFTADYHSPRNHPPKNN